MKTTGKIQAKSLELIETKQVGRTSPSRPICTIADARRLLARIISEFRAGTMDDREARTLCYMLATFVSIVRDSELENRLDALEQQLPKGNTA